MYNPDLPLEKQLREEGVEDADELVHTVVSGMASDINNRGFASQIAWLIGSSDLNPEEIYYELSPKETSEQILG